jgi:citronellyl-CoA dehydrogenase
MQITAEHIALQDSVRQFIAGEITPHIAEWEKAGIFPAHELFRKMGALGFLGVNKPVQ